MVGRWVNRRAKGRGAGGRHGRSSSPGLAREIAPGRRLRPGRPRPWAVFLALTAGASLTTATVAVPAGPATADQPLTATTITFKFAGHPESFTVPAGVDAVDMVASGGHGGKGGGVGGPGIEITAQHAAVKPGQQLRVVVGGNGGSPETVHKTATGGAGGYNGGADGARGGGGGGGFSYVQAPDGNHLVIAAGGGGGGQGVGGPQNPPGTLDGQNGSGSGSLGTPRGGGGGTLTAGGAGGHNASPLVGDGKGGGRYSGGEGGVGLIPKLAGGGGGGGGGYFGGGGGAGSEIASGGGGGAGSSYVAPNVQVIVTPHQGPAEVKITYVRATATSVNSRPDPTDIGTPFDYIATVTPTPSGGTVSFEDLNYHKPYAGCLQLPVVNGVATCHAQVSFPGQYFVTARYSGDADFLPSQGDLGNGHFVMSPTTMSLAVAPRSKNPSKAHERVFFLAKVVPQTATSRYPSGVVFLSIDGRRQFQGDLHGTFEVQIPADFDTIGNHAVTATFIGDNQYRGSTSPPLTQQVTAGESGPKTNLPATTKNSPPST